MEAVGSGHGEQVLTTQEAAKLLRVSVLTLRKTIQERKLPAHRMGRKYMFLKSELIEWLRRQ